MESKVGRMGSSFYSLFSGETRIAYLWERALHTDMPNVPPRQRLEFYEVNDRDLWLSLFEGCLTIPGRVQRFQELVRDGKISIRRLNKSPSGIMRVLIFDGEQVVIHTPPADTDLAEVIEGWEFPKSLAWSNLIVKEQK